MVTDPNLLKEVLTIHHYDYTKTPEGSKFLALLLGNGLLVAEVGTWIRKLLDGDY